MTRKYVNVGKYVLYFNSHAHVERDAMPESVSPRFTVYFNSHAHVERDLHHVELTDGGKYNFNSHAHVERDPLTLTIAVQF